MLREYTIGNRLIKVEPYSSLPCDLMVFTINDKDAYRDDFGTTIDENTWNAPDYGCGCKVFKRYTEKDKIKKCMDKYLLTWEEYYDICDIIEEVLYVGMCGMCS